MSEYTDFDSLFKRIDRDIQVSLENVSKQIVDIWKGLVEENFYDKFGTPKVYSRTWESLDSIRVLKIKKLPNGHVNVDIGYDESKIKTYDMSSEGLWTKHERPELMGSLIEQGWNHIINGIRTQHEGAHALEYLEKYVKSNDFRALFSAELKKLGYTVI